MSRWWCALFLGLVRFDGVNVAVWTTRTTPTLAGEGPSTAPMGRQA